METFTRLMNAKAQRDAAALMIADAVRTSDFAEAKTLIAALDWATAQLIAAVAAHTAETQNAMG